jgi:hypothetical protein
LPPGTAEIEIIGSQLPAQLRTAMRAHSKGRSATVARVGDEP